MSKKQETINTYNTSAIGLAKKFDDQGARIDDIEYTLSIVGKKNPFVFEIGCGNGRDAYEICKRTDHYEGMDISEQLLALAKEKLPNIHFILADVETFEFPKNINVVFAFASLIHVPKESFTVIMSRLFDSVTHNGLVFVSLKHADTYREVTKTDEFGTRTYWHYSQKDMEDVASGFSIVKTNVHDIRGQVWMEVLFQKK